MSTPSIDKIVAELDAGVAAMDAEIKAVHDRRVEIVGATDDMRRRTEALARSRFVIAEQLAQLKQAIAQRADDADPSRAPHLDPSRAQSATDRQDLALVRDGSEENHTEVVA